MRFLLIFLLAGCGVEAKQSEETDGTLSDLQRVQSERIREGRQYVDQNGWIAGDDCDGMIWSAKWGTFVEGFDIDAAEYEPGKFGRRPPNPRWCWEDGEDLGSKSEWSGDMGLLGLFPYAWLTGDRELIEQHIQYGERNSVGPMAWRMGEGEASRAIYRPSLVGLAYQLRFALGGSNDARRQVQSTYPAGLEDYQAHLQMMHIFLRGDTTGLITPQMRDRVVEHSEREPFNPFYQYLRGVYVDDLASAVELCKNVDTSVGTYVRCATQEACEIAEAVWSCGLVIRKLEKERSDQ